MILVFSAFILSGQQVIGEIGIGLAAAVLLDAFLLRTLLAPALMHLSGRANWWLPGWLDRGLPHLSIEPSAQHTDNGSPPRQPSSNELSPATQRLTRTPRHSADRGRPGSWHDGRAGQSRKRIASLASRRARFFGRGAGVAVRARQAPNRR
jgi:hypothetical protein